LPSSYAPLKILAQINASPEVVKATPAKVDPEAQASLEQMREALYQDVLAHVPPQPQPDSNEVISISDPQAIAEFDAAMTGTFKRDPDRVELGRGFFALRDIQAGTGKIVWRCFNHRGEFSANKATPELAQKWFDDLRTWRPNLASLASASARSTCVRSRKCRKR
jgi:hypothetical protein